MSVSPKQLRADAEIIANAVRSGYAVKHQKPPIIQHPTDRQDLFLGLDIEAREAFYGGAAGGGKSSALLMAALRYVDVPGYAALLLRRTFSDLSKPGALIDRAHQWLNDSAAKWSEQKRTWTFPSGATLSFGYLETDLDKYQYQGAEYQFIGFDELTQFREAPYTYLFSRLRRLKTSDIPLRMRAASNPGGIGAEWVRERFVPEGFTTEDARQQKVFWKDGYSTDGKPTRRAFVPATLDDNPYLDREEYAHSLQELDPVTREQLLRGDWSIRSRGNILPMWDEKYHIVSWSEWAAIVGQRGIPQDYLLGVFEDMGQTEEHPCVTTWFATASERSPFPGLLIAYRQRCVWGWTVKELATDTIEKMKWAHERERVRAWEMSHEALSERIEYRRIHNLPFNSWRPGKNRGVAQLRAYHEINYAKQHPVRTKMPGAPKILYIVADDELVYPKTDAGFVRTRAEAPAYKWKELKSGEPMSVVEPDAQFNDAMDTIREACARYGMPIDHKTPEELRNERLDPRIQKGAIAQLPIGPERDAAILSQRVWLDEFRQEEEMANPQGVGPMRIGTGPMRRN